MAEDYADVGTKVMFSHTWEQLVLSSPLHQLVYKCTGTFAYSSNFGGPEYGTQIGVEMQKCL